MHTGVSVKRGREPCPCGADLLGGRGLNEPVMPVCLAAWNTRQQGLETGRGSFHLLVVP